MSVTGKDIRHARQFLRSKTKAGTKDIPPRRFAAAAKEQNVTFPVLLNMIRYYYASGDEREKMRHDQLNKRSAAI
jgi:hypothetical protein